METEFWQQRWQANEIGFHQAEINPYLPQYWPQLELPTAGEVFVPLAGKSLDMWWLRDQGHRVLGVELSPVAVTDFFRTAGVTPQNTHSDPFDQYSGAGVSLLCGDFFALDRARLASVSAVFDRASLVAMPPAMRRRYAAHLIEILPATCSILLVTMEYPESEMQGPPFPVTESEVRQLFGSRFTIDRWAQHDILDQTPQFRARGLTSLKEKVFLLAHS